MHDSNDIPTAVPVTGRSDGYVYVVEVEQYNINPIIVLCQLGEWNIKRWRPVTVSG